MNLKKYLSGTLLTALIAFALCRSLLATTILQFDLAELTELSGCVFEGEVLEINTEERGGLIYTYVLFAVAEVIKGDNPGAYIELQFLGGEGANTTLSVSGLRLPEPGEHGIYFIDSLHDEAVNPLTGWSQGQYLIRTDENGIDYISLTDSAFLNPAKPTTKQQLADKFAGFNGTVPEQAQSLSADSALRVSPAEFKAAIYSLAGQ